MKRTVDFLHPGLIIIIMDFETKYLVRDQHFFFFLEINILFLFFFNSSVVNLQCYISFQVYNIVI